MTGTMILLALMLGVIIVISLRGVLGEWAKEAIRPTVSKAAEPAEKSDEWSPLWTLIGVIFLLSADGLKEIARSLTGEAGYLYLPVLILIILCLLAPIEVWRRRMKSELHLYDYAVIGLYGLLVTAVLAISPRRAEPLDEGMWILTWVFIALFAIGGLVFFKKQWRDLLGSCVLVAGFQFWSLLVHYLSIWINR